MVRHRGVVADAVREPIRERVQVPEGIGERVATNCGGQFARVVDRVESARQERDERERKEDGDEAHRAAPGRAVEQHEPAIEDARDEHAGEEQHDEEEKQALPGLEKHLQQGREECTNEGRERLAPRRGTPVQEAPRGGRDIRQDDVELREDVRGELIRVAHHGVRGRRLEHGLHDQPRPIILGLGACYLLGPKFFQHFDLLYAPTFLMGEEFFLAEQVKTIDQSVYYDPRFVVHHHGAATTNEVPSRRLWTLSRDSHHVYKQFLGLSVSEQRDRIMRASRLSA